MANSGGGIILYGVRETQKAATERIDDGVFDKAYERTLASAAITVISPPVFGLGVHSIGTADNRAVAVEVPASVDGPHLIYNVFNPALVSVFDSPMIVAVLDCTLEVTVTVEYSSNGKKRITDVYTRDVWHLQMKTYPVSLASALGRLDGIEKQLQYTPGLPYARTLSE